MSRVAAVSLLLAALAPAAGAEPLAPPEPCAAAQVQLPEALEEIIARARVELETYRAAWRRACDPSRGAADVGALLADAEALVGDVRTGRAVAALARTLRRDAAWPLPGIRRRGEVVDVDWPTFVAFAPRGTAEDGRFFRGLARATRADGDPSWLGEPSPQDGAPCVRLGEVSWVEVARGIDEMERSSGDVYAARAELVRARLVETLERLGRGGDVCACVRGDPLPGLDALAATRERLGTPARRALLAAVDAAADAVRTGRARVSWLRAAHGAPPTGCGGGPR